MKAGLGISLNNSRSVSAASFDTDTQAVLDYATSQGYTLPSASTQTALNSLIVSAKSDGVWSLLDVFYMFATDGDRGFAKINIKNPGTHNATEVGSMTFTTNQGFNTDGTTGYLRSNYIPSVNGVNFQTSNGSAFAWAYNYPTAASTITGANSNSSGFINVTIRDGSNNNLVRLNNQSSGSVTFSDTNPGLLHSDRNSGTVRAYKNGVLSGTPQVLSAFAVDRELYLCAFNLAGSPSFASSDAKISVAGYGASLSSKASELYTIINNYMTSI